MRIASKASLILRLNETSLVRKEVLRDLLRDGRRTLRAAVGSVVLSVENRGARHAGEVDAAVLLEILVFAARNRVDDRLRNGQDRQIKPALLGIFTEQRSISGVNARHHRRLVILQLRVIRKVLRKVPDRSGDCGDADKEHDRSGREQEAHEPQQQAASSVSVLKRLARSPEAHDRASEPNYTIRY